MKSVKRTDNNNCIHTPASCIEWNYGSIEYLNICNGDMLPEIIWEIVNKLKNIAGQDLSSFDIDTLLLICNQKAPFEKNLISILEIIKNNQICLKDYINALAEQIAEIGKTQNVKVNLKCLADFDNFGNQLGITRESLDQIVVDKLCNHETRINTTEGKITSLQNQINNININPQVQEPEFSTCVDNVLKPTSGQVLSIANKVCNIENYLGGTLDASEARSNFNFEDSRYLILFPDTWIVSSQRQNILDDYNNLILVVKDLEARIIDIQSNCCAPTCDKIMIGFSIIEVDGDYILRFRPSDGTNLFGFKDIGSQVRFTGTNKITKETVTAGPFPIAVDEEENDIMLLSGTFDLSKPITVSLQVRVSKDGLTCEKCISQTIDISSGCPVCEVVASGDKGDTGTITITYEYE